MAFVGLADFQELVASGHSCKYLFLPWEQGRCQVKQLWLLSCRSPHGEGFPMTCGPGSQDAVPFPRRAVGDFDENHGWGMDWGASSLSKVLLWKHEDLSSNPSIHIEKLVMVVHISNSSAE